MKSKIRVLAALAFAASTWATAANADPYPGYGDYYPPCYSQGSTGLEYDLESPFLNARREILTRDYRGALFQLKDLERAIRYRLNSGNYPSYPNVRDPAGCFYPGRTGLGYPFEDLYLRTHGELLNNDLGDALNYVQRLQVEVRNADYNSHPTYPAPVPPSYPPYNPYPPHPPYPGPSHPYPPHPPYPGPVHPPYPGPGPGHPPHPAPGPGHPPYPPPVYVPTPPPGHPGGGHNGPGHPPGGGHGGPRGGGHR